MSVIDGLVAGIIRMEGEPLTSTNPGNLRDAPWFPGSYGHRTYYDGVTPLKYNIRGFWVPRTRQEGVSGLEHDVWLHVCEGWTLVEFIAGRPLKNVANPEIVIYMGGYAPASDGNDPVKYVASLVQWLGGTLNPNLPLWDALHEPTLPASI